MSDELPQGWASIPHNPLGCLASEAITELEAVVDDLCDIVELLEKEEGVEK